MISRFAIAIVVLLCGLERGFSTELCHPTFSTDYEFFDGGNAKSRLYVIPGVAGSAKAFLTQEIIEKWVGQMAADGHDVVVVNTLPPMPCYFADGGASYRAGYIDDLGKIVANANTMHKVAKSNILIGSSYGGVHGLIGFAATDLFDAWVAWLPVTKLAALSELSGVGEVPQFDPFRETEKLSHSAGLILWGENDMRVDHRLTEALYDKIRSPGITAIGYPSTEHETTEKQVKDVSDWIEARGVNYTRRH